MTHRTDTKLTVSSLGREQVENTKPFKVQRTVKMLITQKKNFTDTGFEQH